MVKNLIFAFFVLFFLSGCSSSSLKLNKNDQLLLVHDKNSSVLGTDVIKHDFLNFKDLFVNRYIIVDANSRVLFFENATTDLSFEFDSTEIRSVMAIFDSKEYQLLCKEDEFLLVQLELKDGYLNIMIQLSGLQELSFVYGFSNEEFVSLAYSLNKDAKKELPILKNEAMTFDKSSDISTKWDSYMVFFTPLITPSRFTDLP